MVRKRVAAGLAALSMIASAPASAAGAMSSAEKLRRLDIMLMVTGLRCRSGPDNFTAEYQRFTANHIGELNRAAAQLRSQLAARHGAAGAERALDRMSVTMANEYGQGHPWLDCAQLRTAARNLADVRGAQTLEEAAEQLLGAGGQEHLAYGRR